MKIRVGFEFVYEFVERTPMVLMLNVHPSRAGDLIRPDQLRFTPTLPITRYADMFGNVCSRVLAPAGRIEICTDAVVADSGRPDPVEPGARAHEIAELPHDTLVFLLGSRYCETERLMNTAWSLFRKTPAGWPRVRRSAISSSPMSASATDTHASPRPRPTPSSSAAACAATLPIWRSRCAAA